MSPDRCAVPHRNLDFTGPNEYDFVGPDRVTADGTMSDRELPKFGSRDYAIIAILMAIGAAVRLLFLSAQCILRFDSWRHLLLVENLRAGRGLTL